MSDQLEIMQFVNEAAIEMAVEEVDNLEDLQDKLADVAWKIAEDAKALKASCRPISRRTRAC